MTGRILKNSIHNDFHAFNTFSIEVWMLFIVSIAVMGFANCYSRKLNIENPIMKTLVTYNCMLGQACIQLSQMSQRSLMWASALLVATVLIKHFETFILIILQHELTIIIDSIVVLLIFWRFWCILIVKMQEKFLRNFGGFWLELQRQ